MKKRTRLVLSSVRTTFLALAALAPSVGGQTDVVSTLGPGGNIPDAPDESGGLGKWGPVWNGPIYWPALISPVTVPTSVDRVTAVVIQGLQHTYRDDLHVYLENPAGLRFNLVVRPDVVGAFLLGTYTIVESGGASLVSGGGSLSGGTYNQYLNTGVDMWTSAAYPIANLPLQSISGQAGVWKLHLRDWFPNDVGSITGWSLHGENDGDVTPFCFGDNSGAQMSCPCAPGAPGHGCANSSGVGALLSASGSASVAANDLTLLCTGMLPGSASMFLQSMAPVNYGFGQHSPTTDGLQCIDALAVRVDRRGTIGSTASVGDVVVNGGIPGAGGVRYYVVFYRNIASYCTPANWNTSNAVKIKWRP